MKTLITLSAAALLSTAALADDESKNWNKDQSKSDTQASFESLDRNSDQRLSRSEVSAQDGMSVQFASLDQDSDGYVTETEYTAHQNSSERSNPVRDDY